MANQETRIVGRLTRSLPLSRPDGLPVYVARAPRLHSVKRLGRDLTQTPCNSRSGGWYLRL